MSIDKIVKAHIICSSADREKILKKLQLWGNMELIKSEQGPILKAPDNAAEIVSRLEFIVGLLEGVGLKESAWQRLKQGLPVLEEAGISRIEQSIDIDSDYENLRALETRNKEISTKIDDFSREIAELEEIKAVKLSGSDLEFNKAHACIAKIDKDKIPALLEEEGIYVEQILDSEKPVVAVIYMDGDPEIVRIVHEHCAHKVKPPYDRTPAERIKELKSAIKGLESEKEETGRRIETGFLDRLFEYRALLDIYENKKMLETETVKLGSTRYTSIISGWIPACLKEELENLLKRVSLAFHVDFLKPGKKDNPPVLLRNTGVFEPFEVVTSLYGTPDYHWLDPTPYLAPFFAFFFGLCITDAGYGIIITLLCLLSIVKLKLSGSVKRFLKLLMLGGIATIITGALTGGWFGNVLEGTWISSKLRVIDPLEKPEYFLYFSVLLGYIQVVFGIFLSALRNIQTKNTAAAFFEDMPWLVVLLGLPLCFIGGLLTLIGKVFIGAGLAGIIFFSGHRNKNIVSRIGTGLYTLYGGTDYFKDMISYSRLFALGMGTGILAMAINEIASMVAGIPVVGFLLAILILVPAHILNMLMNILSGYVHTSRLQYVEFFTKFFKGGGRNFEPFSWKGKRIVLVGR